MNYRHFILTAALAGIAAMSPLLTYAQQPRAVIELFTSQGCSSCPPADSVLSELARDPSLITMSLPVDYWDYLGWKDTLALHHHSSRERAYAEVRGDRDVFTPQVVVNGIIDVLGSDMAAIEQAVEKSHRESDPMDLPVTMTVVDGKVTVQVPDAKDGHNSAEVWLCPITHKVSVAVARGENGGHRLTYTNVVRRWVRLGSWTGKASTYSIPVSELPDEKVALKDIDRVSVLVQSGVASKPGLMLGAATASLH
jgi:hypothetical protein